MYIRHHICYNTIYHVLNCCCFSSPRICSLQSYYILYHMLCDVFGTMYIHSCSLMCWHADLAISSLQTAISSLKTFIVQINHLAWEPGLKTNPSMLSAAAWSLKSLCHVLQSTQNKSYHHRIIPFNSHVQAGKCAPHTFVTTVRTPMSSYCVSSSRASPKKANACRSLLCFAVSAKKFLWRRCTGWKFVRIFCRWCGRDSHFLVLRGPFGSDLAL